MNRAAVRPLEWNPGGRRAVEGRGHGITTLNCLSAFVTGPVSAAVTVDHLSKNWFQNPFVSTRPLRESRLVGLLSRVIGRVDHDRIFKSPRC